MLRLLCVGVGGQGVLTATRILGEAALQAGRQVVLGQLHGMSQRGGSVESTVLFSSSSPLSSAFVGPGEADMLVALEPLEALRALPRLHARACVVVNRDAIVPFSMTLASRSYPDVDAVLLRLKEKSGRVVAFPGGELAARAGSPRAVNIVALGVLAELSVLPFPDAALWGAIEAQTPAAAIDINRRAFALGREQVAS